MGKRGPRAHQLAAIMFTDIVDYTAVMARDEEAGLRLRARHRGAVRPLVTRYSGEWIEERGDESLCCFPSAVDAVNCALAIQEALRGDPELKIRIGIHLADIVVERGSVYGDGVNVASRIRPLAEPCCISISDEVQRLVRNQPNIEARSMGTHELKSVPGRMPVFAVTGAASPPSHARTLFPEARRRALRVGAAARAAVRSFSADAKAAAQPAPVAAEPAGDLHKPAIAILPFDNLSGDPEQEYFSDGLTEDITTELSKFPHLLVIAANSAFAYKGRRTKPQDVGRNLGVHYLLEGSVHRADDRVRINAQLVDTRTGLHLWAERFGAAMSHLFALQDEIIQKIVVALAFKIESLEEARATCKDPVNMNAYEAYLEGVHVFSYESEKALQHCREMFERATRLDPNLARAWGYLGYCDARAVLGGWRDPEALVQAEAFAKRAVAIDGYDYANHWDLAFVYLNSGRFDQAMTEYRRALVLNPNDADLLAEIAEMLVYAGEPEKAIAQLERAMRINPYYPDWYLWNLGWGYYHVRDYARALEQFKRMSNPPNDVRLFVAAGQAQLGDSDAARATLERFLQQKKSPYTLRNVKLRGHFKRPEDEEHWLEGLRKAGLPD